VSSVTLHGPIHGYTYVSTRLIVFPTRTCRHIPKVFRVATSCLDHPGVRPTVQNHGQSPAKLWPHSYTCGCRCSVVFLVDRTKPKSSRTQLAHVHWIARQISWWSIALAGRPAPQNDMISHAPACKLSVMHVRELTNVYWLLYVCFGLWPFVAADRCSACLITFDVSFSCNDDRITCLFCLGLQVALGRSIVRMPWITHSFALHFWPRMYPPRRPAAPRRTRAPPTSSRTHYVVHGRVGDGFTCWWKVAMATMQAS
jgi:hypothetical protein